jgi:hypothetical protein
MSLDIRHPQLLKDQLLQPPLEPEWQTSGPITLAGDSLMQSGALWISHLQTARCAQWCRWWAEIVLSPTAAHGARLLYTYLHALDCKQY